jgi:mannose-6-phosphate isomerase-like protein (cupin superfamily)
VSYTIALPSSPSFALRGLKGYQFQALKNQDLDIYILDVRTGHDTFIISKKLYRIYYILEGRGYFTIEDQKYNVEAGTLVEVPPGVEYTYSGTMSAILISTPRWFEGNEQETRENQDVPSRSLARSLVSRLRALGKTIWR